MIADKTLQQQQQQVAPSLNTKHESLEMSQAPVPRLEDALKMVSDSTSELISHREMIAELECRIDEGIYLVRALMRVLRRAKAMVILLKPKVWPELTNYVAAIESSYERAARRLSQLQDIWYEHTYNVLPLSEKAKRDAQRSLNHVANQVLIEVPPSPESVIAAPRIRRRMGRPHKDKTSAVERAVSAAMPPKNPTRSRSVAISKPRDSRPPGLRRKSQPLIVPGDERFNHVELSQPEPALNLHHTSSQNPIDANIVPDVSMQNPWLNFQEATVVQHSDLLDSQGSSAMQNSEMNFLPDVPLQQFGTEFQATAAIQQAGLDFQNTEAVLDADLNIQTDVTATSASETVPNPAIFPSSNIALDPNSFALPSSETGFVSEYIMNTTSADGVGGDDVTNVGQVLVDNPENGAANMNRVELAALINLMPQEARQNTNAEFVSQMGTPPVTFEDLNIEQPAEVGEAEKEVISKFHEMLEQSPDKMDFESMIMETPQKVRDLQENIDGMNLDDSPLGASWDMSTLLSPNGSEPETMRGNSSGEGSFDDDHPISPRIEDEEAKSRWNPSNLFTDKNHWGEMLPEVSMKSHDYEKYRETPGSPSMFEVHRVPSPRGIKSKLEDLWDMDIYNVKEDPTLIVNRNETAEPKRVKIEEEPQIAELTYFGDETVKVEPKAVKIKEEPQIAELTETLGEDLKIEPRRVKVKKERQIVQLTKFEDEPEKLEPRKVKIKEEPQIVELTEFLEHEEESELKRLDDEHVNMKQEHEVIEEKLTSLAEDRKSSDSKNEKAQVNGASARKFKNHDVSSEVLETPSMQHNQLKSVVEESEPTRKAKSKKSTKKLVDGKRKPKSRAAKKKHNTEMEAEQEVKISVAKKKEEANGQSIPRTRAAKKKEAEAKVEQKSKRRAAGKKKDAETDVVQKPKSRTSKKKENAEVDVEQKPRTRAAKRKENANANVKASVSNKPKTRSGTRREEVESSDEEKPKTWATKNKEGVKVEKATRIAAAKKDEEQVDEKETRKGKTRSKKDTISSSVNRLYPSNNAVRFKYEPKKSRHESAYAAAASAPEPKRTQHKPTSVSDLYPTNNKVKFRYERKPSRHNKSYKPPASNTQKSKTAPTSTSTSTQKKAVAQETIDRLYPKQTNETKEGPPRRSARLREKEEALNEKQAKQTTNTRRRRYKKLEE